MGDDITIGVTEIVNNIEVTAQPNDQVIDINVTDNSDEVTLNVTPNVIEVNINKGSSYARWGSIFGNLTDQADLTNALFNKADLVDGKVPSYQLPSFVDDVIEVANYAALPTFGEIGKIYITLDDNKIYRWSGSIYIEIASNQAIWGAITGSLINQTDLVNALNLKANISGQVFTGAISATNLSGTNTGDQDLSGLVPNTRTLTINGTTFDLSANRTYTIPTHDAVTLGTANGLSLSGQVLSLALAGTSSTGALSSTDWNTFNNKQSALNGTGFVKISGTTISYDNSDYVPTSRTITINGVTQDLSANRSFTVASGVTSVFGRTGDVVAANGDYTTTQVTEGTNLYYTEARVNANANVAANTAARHSAVTIGTANGLSLSGQALSLALASGSTTGALSSTDWNTFNNKLSSLSGAVLTTTDQSITGTKTFNVSTSNDAILVNNSGGRAIRINNSTAGFGLLINNDTSSSAIPLAIQKNGTTNFSVSDIGHISTASIAATTIVKSGGTAAQILAADGTVITAGTNITISGGTISASGGMSGSGTTNFLPKFTGSSALGNSQIFDNGSSVMIGTSGTSSAKLSVSHDAENLGAIFTSNTNTSNYVDQISINYRGVGKMISCRGATTAEVFNVSNVGGGYFAGNVGIGTTSPSDKLDVNGVIRGLMPNDPLSGAITAKFLSFSGNPFGLIFRGYATGAHSIQSQRESSDSTLFPLSLQPLGGNVGIGTTSPAEKLHVNGNLKLSASDSRIIAGDSVGRVIMSNSDVTTYFAMYGSSHATAPNLFQIVANNIAALTIPNTGNVGIGTTSPSYQLQLSTDSAAKPTSALWTIASDERIKENINSYTKGLNELLKINPITYDYNGLGGFKKGKGGVGIIAQEIAEILPDSVSSIKGKLNETDEEEIDILNFNGHELTYILINAVKELKSEIELLKQK